MHLDLTTLALQLVNFLALVLLLHRFLFKPVLGAIDRREADLSARRQEAEGLATEARAAREAVDADRATLAAEAQALREKASAAAAEERRQILDNARQSADGLRKAAEDKIAAERQRAEATLTARTGDLALAIAGRLLADARPELADDLLCHALAADLRRLSDDARATQLAGDGEITLTIARDWPAERRQGIERLLPAGRAVWRIDPAIIAGVELSGAHHLIHHSWRAALASAQDRLRA